MFVCLQAPTTSRGVSEPNCINLDRGAEMRFASRGLLCVHGFVGTDANIGVVPMGCGGAFRPPETSDCGGGKGLQQILGLGSFSVYLESSDTVILGEEIYHLVT